MALFFGRLVVRITVLSNTTLLLNQLDSQTGDFVVKNDKGD